MKQARYAEVASRLLRRLRPEGTPSFPRNRAALVAAIDQELRKRARRRGAVQRGLAVGAAAAVVIAVGFVGARRHPAVTSAVNRPTNPPLTVFTAVPGAAAGSGGQWPLPLRQGMVITAGLRLTAPAIAEVEVGTANGTTLTIEKGGDLTVNETGATQRFALNAGSLRAHVSRLIAGQRFLVDTADAEVEVHGTTFRVSVVAGDPQCGGSVHTRVSVTEGVVTVRSALGEARVVPGAVWPGGCPTTPPAASGAPEGVRRSPKRAVFVAASAPAHEAAVPPAAVFEAPPAATSIAKAEPGSLLAQQNDLFAEAVRAKRDGRAPEAVDILEKLIRSFPEGSLVESAMAQRMKILSSYDSARAGQAAAQYIARFPAGFARADAERLIVRSSP